MAEKPLATVPSAWIAQAIDFPKFLDMAFESHFGEVWLFNNDLKMLTEDWPFRELYLKRIAQSLAGQVDAVKIIVSREHDGAAFPKSGNPPDHDLLQHLEVIAGMPNGKDRLATFYFGSMATAHLPEALQQLSIGQTWVFYTHRHVLDPNPGIVIVRQNTFPFEGTNESDTFALVWQMNQQAGLQLRLKQAFEACFNDQRNFRHIRVVRKKPFQYEWVDGWSSVTAKRLRIRKKQRSDALAFGERVDVAVIASQDEEIAPLEEILEAQGVIVQATPLNIDEHRCAVIHRKAETRRVLIGVVGEGNVSAAAKTWEILERWAPRYAILIGVAGGHPSEQAQRLGDVVVGEKIIGYEHGKVVRGGFEGSWTKYEIVQGLISVLDRVARRWQARLVGPRPDGGAEHPRAHKVTIASGSKLVADEGFFDWLRQETNNREIRALEMEADGVGCACTHHPGTMMMVVKGIMDKCNAATRDLDVGTREKWKKYASRAAADFVSELLSELP